MRPTHALLHRTLRGWLLAAALVGSVQVAHAAYQNATPPPGFSGSPGAWAYKPGAAEKWLARTAETRTTVNVGGRTVTMNALLRMSATAAPRFAAALVWTPLGRAAAVGLAMSALATQLLQHGIQWSQERQQWERIEDVGWWTYSGSSPQYATAAAACQAFVGYWNSTNPQNNSRMVYVNVVVSGAAGTCKVNEYNREHGYLIESNKSHGIVERGATTPQPVAVEEAEFVGVATPYITPDVVPDLAPDQPIPVELPIINPSTDPEPKSRPLRVPLGDPLPNPQPEGAPVPAPYPWRQPVVDITPSPTQVEPWRVDSTPKDILLPTPDGIEEPTPQPPTDPEAAPPTNEAPSEPGLCALYPDILACARPDLDTPEQDIPKKTENITYTEMNLWGGGACPSNVAVSVNGQTITALDMASTCSLITTYLRPMVIAASALSAMFILMGSRGGDTI